MTDTSRPAQFPAGATPDGDGIVLGKGPVTVEAYVDFLCPYCRQFELGAGPALDELVSQGRISLVYHPMSFLDEASTTRYSSRAAAAAGCAADQGRFAQYARQLYTHQPPEGGAGLPDAQLVELGAGAGLDQQALAACVQAGRYLDWAPYITRTAEARGVQATPTVLVNGTEVNPDPRAIESAVEQA
jgi:protein-disulfide isomerase